MECKNALEIEKNENGEVICHCKVTDRWESVTHGECIGNCNIEEPIEKKKPGRPKRENSDKQK